jgi:hypothetical protein
MRMTLGFILGLALVSAYFGIYTNKACLNLAPGPSVFESKEALQPSSLTNQSIVAVEGRSDLDDEVLLKQRFYASVVAEWNVAAVQDSRFAPRDDTVPKRVKGRVSDQIIRAHIGGLERLCTGTATYVKTTHPSKKSP